MLIPISWGVDVHGFLGLTDPIGFFICFVGLASQVWITRGRKWLFSISIAVAVTLLLLFGTIDEYWWPHLYRHIRGHTAAWFTALLQLWCLLMTSIAGLLIVRDLLWKKFKPERRAFFRASTAAIFAVPTAVTTFGIISRKDFFVNEVEIKLPNLPKDLHNVRIVQISDIHLSAFYHERDLMRAVDAANNLRGDLAIVTGDLITTWGDPLEACIRQIGRLKNTSGIYGCMGNHETFTGTEFRATELGKRYGVDFLRSRAQLLKFGNAHLNLAGVDYQSPRMPYLVGAEELVEPGYFNLLLSHNPDVFPVATDKGFDLVLAGHTHGGQINVDLFDKNINIANFVTPYSKGLYTDVNSAVYVNPGLGTIGMPLRLGAAPEISLIKLCAS